MAARSEQLVVDDDADEIVRAVRTRPGRVVFTADGLPDAWIASDLAVDLRR